jgi:transposase
MSKLEKIKKNAAGIDLGSKTFFVSVDGETVKSFETHTSALQCLVLYLVEKLVATVAMESTGVLWLPLYDMLEEAGIEVFLVNAAHAKNIPAQKSDPADCRWLQKLHSFGMLRASYVPSDEIRKLRTYIRQREDHQDMAASHIQHMQKAMELMNLKLKNVISQLHGVSGQKVIQAILDGEKDAHKLASLCDPSILNKKKEAVIESLKGNYKEEYIFMLRQAFRAYQFYQNQIKECDKEVDKILIRMTIGKKEIKAGDAKPSRHNQPEIKKLHNKLVKLHEGKNPTVLPGISDMTTLKLTAELGCDYTKWPTEKHFTSWLGLSPRKHQSGKTNKKQKRKVNSKAGQIFKESAMSIANSKYLALKGFYYRIKSKHEARAAIKATARKLAVLYYRYMTIGINYVEIGLHEYETRYKEQVFKNISKKASSLGYQLIRV